MDKPKSVWVNLRKPKAKMSQEWKEHKEYVCSDLPKTGWTEYVVKTVTKKKGE